MFKKKYHVDPNNGNVARTSCKKTFIKLAHRKRFQAVILMRPEEEKQVIRKAFREEWDRAAAEERDIEHSYSLRYVQFWRPLFRRPESRYLFFKKNLRVSDNKVIQAEHDFLFSLFKQSRFRFPRLRRVLQNNLEMFKYSLLPNVDPENAITKLEDGTHTHTIPVLTCVWLSGGTLYRNGQVSEGDVIYFREEFPHKADDPNPDGRATLSFYYES